MVFVSVCGRGGVVTLHGTRRGRCARSCRARSRRRHGRLIVLRRVVLLLRRLLLVPAGAAAAAAGKASVLLLLLLLLELLLLELRGLDRGQRQRGLHGRRRAILPYPAVVVFRAWRRGGRARVIGREWEDNE